MTAICLSAGGRNWSGRYTANSAVSTALLAALPLTDQVVQDPWSRDVMVGLGTLDFPVTASDRLAPYQYRGQLLYDIANKRLALCFGDGRLQDGMGPLAAIPLVSLQGDLDELQEFGKSLQFVGATVVRITIADEAPAEPEPRGVRVQVTLGSATARFTLVEQDAEVVAKNFHAQLPMTGRGTNTVSSGPLCRFWRDGGGPQGETILENAASESKVYRNQILTPGYLYYNPGTGFRGIRIPYSEATLMRHITGPVGVGKLIPFGKMVGDWSEFAAEAATLTYSGAKPMHFKAM